MLLALDVGNTNIVIGFLDESGIRNIARLETDRDKTAHEYAISLRQVIEFSGIAPENIDGAILSSVVPPINGALIAAVRMITGIRPLVVGPGMKTGLNIALDNPATMGSDLVVGAAAALAIHDPPLIIIDMGTATTMTILDRVYQREATSSCLNSLARMARAGRNAKEIMIPKVSMTGFGTSSELIESRATQHVRRPSSPICCCMRFSISLNTCLRTAELPQTSST